METRTLNVQRRLPVAVALICAALLTSCGGGGGGDDAGVAAAPVPITELTQSGKLSDGTEYGFIIPTNWNGTLLLDLDFLMSWKGGSYQALFAQGYGAAGVMRNYTDPIGGQYIRPWVERNLQAADLVAAKVGKPKRTIAWGNSRGGHVAEATAELYPQRIDAAIPKCVYGGAATIMNQDLDVNFTLKMLLAPNDSMLPLVNISNGPATPTAVGLAPALAGWNQLLTEASATPQGRARLALAAAIGQLPDWADASKPRPNPNDPKSIAVGWLDYLKARVGGLGTYSFMRPVYETSAGGNFSWNVGVDYRQLLSGRRKDVVQALYTEAGLDLDKDLDTINAGPRLAPDTAATWFLRDPSVNYGGNLNVPMLTMMTIGDTLLPVTGIWALQEAARNAGKSNMLRMTFTETVGHCAFSVAEDLALVETMKRRLDSGSWDDTSPAYLNALAKRYGAGDSRFIDYQLEPLRRVHLLGDPYPTGGLR